MPTSTRPDATPVAASAKTSCGNDVARPGSVVATAITAQPTATARAPKRSTARPAMRNIAGIAPSDTKSSATPSAPFDVPVACCTLGRTDAHAPQKRPRTTNPASVGPLRGGRTRRPRRVGLPERPPRVPPAAAGVELRGDALALRPDRVVLLARVAALAHALLERLDVLPLPLAARRDPDVELEILCVVAFGRTPERLLEVHVPAREVALGTVPEHPDRVRLTRPLQHQHSVTLPCLAARPRMNLRPGRECEG